MGIILGVAFFLAISSLMQGSEKDFISRLIDNSPHITIVDEFRDSREQPVKTLFLNGAIEIQNVKPLTETRGIRNYERVLTYLRSIDGVRASATLAGQALVTFAGRDHGITLNGMVPDEIKDITTIKKYMVEGSIDELVANPDGIIIGQELARLLSLTMGDNISVVSTANHSRVFKIVGIFRVGRTEFDQRQTFVALKRAQALLNRSHRANNILIKMGDPYQARELSAKIEKEVEYKSVSWQESWEDLMSTLSIRNIIMYTVVSAVLIVAAFGIYNVISTVVMEKQRDIAILKSIGFHRRDILLIFLIQGVILGAVGSGFGLPLGSFFMSLLMQIELKPPGSTEPIQMPIEWSWIQFAIAASFALFAAIIAALLPARKATNVKPVIILRGNQ